MTYTVKTIKAQLKKLKDSSNEVYCRLVDSGAI